MAERCLSAKECRKKALPTGLLIVGFGGHARSVADVAIDLGISEMTFVEESARAGEEFAGFPVWPKVPDQLATNWCIFPAAGDNSLRERQVEYVMARKLPLYALLSRRAYFGTGSTVRAGSFVAHDAHVGPDASIGIGSIINTAAIVEHESCVGDFSHISVNATVAGRCNIGRLVFLGAGATVIDHVRIVDHVVIGAGSTVIDDINEPGVYVGCPARRSEQRL